MKQRTAILLALACTAFVLVLVGAIAFSITSKTVTPEAVTESLPEPEPARVQNLGGGIGLQVLAPAVLPTNAPTATVPAPTSAQPKLVSADRASRIALALFPGGKLQQPPELVNYQGKMAYEVLLSGGTVYVDAFTGKVLANIIAVASNPTPTQETYTDSGGTDSGGNDSGGENNDAGTNEPPPTVPDISAPQNPPPPPSGQPNDDNGQDDNSNGNDKNDDGNDDKNDDGNDDKNDDSNDDKDDNGDEDKHQDEDDRGNQDDHGNEDKHADEDDHAGDD